MLRACRMKDQHYPAKVFLHSLSQSEFLLLRSCLSRVVSLGYLFSLAALVRPQNLSNNRPARHSTTTVLATKTGARVTSIQSIRQI